MRRYLILLTHWRRNQQDQQALLSPIADLIITPCLHYKFVFDDWGISRTSESCQSYSYP